MSANEIPDRQPQVDAVYADIFAERNARREAAAARVHTNGNGTSHIPSLSDQQVIEIASNARNGAKFKALYGGDLGGYPSPSEGDLALCDLLAFFVGRYPERIDSIFRTSGRMRPKWNDPGYRERTIAKALEGRTEFYSAKGASERSWSDVQHDIQSGGNGARPAAPAPVANGRVKLDASAPFKIADELLKSKFERDGVRVLHHWQGSFLLWNGRSFAETDELAPQIANYLHSEVLLTSSGGKKGPKFVSPNSWHTRNVNDALAARAHLSSSIEPPAWLGAARGGTHVIACANGLLDLETRELLKPTPEFFNTAALAANYRPGAECTGWLHFLESLWPQDPQSIETLQDWFGYLIEPNNSQQKMLIVIGPRRGGKGILGRTMEAMLGSAMVAKPSLTNFTQTFGLESMIGKLAAIVSDARLDRDGNTQLAVEHMLKFSGNDNPQIPRKYKTAYTGPTSSCRIVVFTNELPELMDSSGALAGRFTMIRTFRSFFGKEDITLFERTILPETDGIFLWALDGWRRLRERGRFVVPDSAQGLLDNFAEQTDILSGFVDDCVDDINSENPKYILDKGQVYDAYLSWASGHGVKQPLNRNWFFNKLGARNGVDCAYRCDPDTGRTTDENGNKLPRRVKGIKLK
jgi:putative DNA primase/helicase